MSEKNVERLRSLYDEWAKGNLWALRDIADPDMEWEWSEAMANLAGGPRLYRGLDEIGATTLDWISAWDFYWMTADEFVEAGDDVVVFMRLHARMAETDRVVEERLGAVWTLRDGRAVRVRYYDHWAEALEAVGLRE
jgi:ketosteroid isomerase-like protein